MKTYKNETGGRQKVYTDGHQGPFTFLEPGESCQVRLDADQEPKVLDVAPEEAPEQKPDPNTAVKEPPPKKAAKKA